MSEKPLRPKSAPPKPANRPPAKSATPTQSPSQSRSQTSSVLDEDPGTEFPIVNAGLSSGVSFIVHFVVLIVLAMLILPTPKADNQLTIAQEPEVIEEVVENFVVEVPPTPIEATTTDVLSMQPMASAQVEVQSLEITEATDVEMAAMEVELTDFADETAPLSDLLVAVGATEGTGLTGRGLGKRGDYIGGPGLGTKESEAAVNSSLEWIAKHQLPDGSWNFDHTIGPKTKEVDRSSANPGSATRAKNAATAMALLPFLGAGHTHKDGKYKETVRKGLYYLVANMNVKANAGSFEEPEGSFYSHGLAAIALCEAYGMTHDRELMGPAQLAVNHIVNSQDRVGGGWRYQAGQAGDTSVVGWQLMALKSAHMAYLNVPGETVRGAIKFLDSVQTESGAKYGYTGPGSGDATTAVGLLCRMYTGWKQENAALARGVDFLDRPKFNGGSGNMYFNYYATQVVHHFDGPKGEKWIAWNKAMRDPLVALQAKEGAEAGSWYIRGDHGSSRGGRLYCTCMATMMLEVYYRHSPIYRSQATEEDFAL